ncbi:MAG: hypothetical protein RIE86_09255 [Imperialibacter sp.]|uniref:hypothetical protein n=1 Tax=Imperialibacter sp. TaxID=2038411 RepID=UPI0032F07FAD
MSLTDLIAYRSGKLYVTEKYLVEVLGMKQNSVRDGMKRFRKHATTNWENSEAIKLGRKKLINFDTIPFETSFPFNSKGCHPFDAGVSPALPNKARLIADLKAEQATVVQANLSSFFDALPEKWAAFYQGTDELYFQNEFNVNRHAAYNKAKDLSTCVAILRFLVSVGSGATEVEAKTGYPSKKDLQEAVLEHIKAMGLKGLPHSWDRLRKYESQYKKLSQSDTNPSPSGGGAQRAEGVDPRTVVVSGHQGNTSAQKFDEVQRTALLETYLRPHKPDKLECWMDFKALLVKEENMAEDKIISYSRFKQITLERDIALLAAKCRGGSSYYETFVRPFILGKKPEYSMSLVAGDGWQPGRSVKFKWRNPKTGQTVDRQGTMNVWLWFDVKSSFIYSHSVEPFETGNQIRQSFRDIIALQGKCPASVIIDKKWKEQSDTKRMFEKAGVKIENKRAYNPKSNPAERNNKELNKHHRRIDKFWVDMTNNMAEWKHNEEHVRQGKAMEEAEFREMIYQIIERHNYTARKSLGGRTPYEVSQEAIFPQCQSFSPLELTWIFGETTRTTVRNWDVKIEIATRKYHFCIMDADMPTYYRNQHRHDNWVRVYYDERYMDTVDIYSITDEHDTTGDKYICTAINADQIRVNKATVEEPLDHRFDLQRQRQEAVDQIIADELEHHQQMKDSLGWDEAAVMSVSQERYKEAHSNAVAQQYRNFHSQAPAGGTPPSGGRGVAEGASKTKPLTDKEKYDRLRGMINDFNSDDE